MSDRVRPHRHPLTLAVALVIALCAAMLVTVPLAAPADAAALAVSITRLYDGTAPFEDRSPGDTTSPTPDGLHQPGVQRTLAWRSTLGGTRRRDSPTGTKGPGPRLT